ncbi:MAG: hypothetical protein E6R04_02995 [Spirochaetes bacterium]|nr:MAG: hypothetical protein E6R04_02995 [Spirochaetota bacterium]
MAKSAPLRRMVVTVYGIRRHGKSSMGGNIFELDTDRGKFRTAANSTAGSQLNSTGPNARPQRMTLHINTRNTVSGVSAA